MTVKVHPISCTKSDKQEGQELDKKNSSNNATSCTNQGHGPPFASNNSTARGQGAQNDTYDVTVTQTDSAWILTSEERLTKAHVVDSRDSYSEESRTNGRPWHILVSYSQHQNGTKPLPSDVITAHVDQDLYDEDAVEASKTFCWGLCCVQGCIYGLIGMVYFFAFLPSGFLLIMYGRNQRQPWAIGVGAVLLVVSTLAIPSFCIGFRWYRGRQKDRRKAYREARNKAVAAATYINQPTPEDEEAEIT